MLQGSTFSFKKGVLDKLLKNLKEENIKIDKILEAKMKASIDIVYRIARAKRSFIGKGENKISDPNAQYGVPVKTGLLRSSIEREVTNDSGKVSGRVFTNRTAPYDIYLEFGTSKMKARPFMAPALQHSIPEIKRIFIKK